jgi:hypothetical protein
MLIPTSHDFVAILNVVCVLPIYHLFWVFSPQHNGVWDVIQSFNLHLMHHIITTLIVHTKQREHIRYAWNP